MNDPNVAVAVATAQACPIGARPGLLMVGNHLSKWGRARGICEDMALRLEERDWSVICTSSRNSRAGRIGDMLWTLWSRRGSYSVAHVEVYGGRAFLWAEMVCWALRRLRKGYILTLHGGGLPALAAAHPERVRRLFMSAALVTVPSGYLQDRMRPYCPHLFKIPNGIDIRNYSWRQRVEPAPQLVWIRAFHDVYNPAMAVQTLSYVLRDYPHASLTMVGPDNGDGSLEQARTVAANLGIEEHVHFHGFVNKRDIPSLMQTGDIFLNTSRVDNTPVTVIEAMACGLCVVSTNVGGVPYLIDDGADGMLCPPDNAKAMADAVKRLLLETGCAAAISREARRKAESFDWDPIISTWEATFAGVANRVLTGGPL